MAAEHRPDDAPSPDEYGVQPPHAERPAPRLTVTSLERVDVAPESSGEQPIGVAHLLGLLCFEAFLFALARRTHPAVVAGILGVVCFIVLPLLNTRGPARVFLWWALLLSYVLLALAALSLPPAPPAVD